jgi:hypothetical protein
MQTWLRPGVLCYYFDDVIWFGVLFWIVRDEKKTGGRMLGSDLLKQPAPEPNTIKNILIKIVLLMNKYFSISVRLTQASVEITSQPSLESHLHFVSRNRL